MSHLLSAQPFVAVLAADCLVFMSRLVQVCNTHTESGIANVYMQVGWREYGHEPVLVYYSAAGLPATAHPLPLLPPALTGLSPQQIAGPFAILSSDFPALCSCSCWQLAVGPFEAPLPA